MTYYLFFYFFCVHCSSYLYFFFFMFFIAREVFYFVFSKVDRVLSFLTLNFFFDFSLSYFIFNIGDINVIGFQNPGSLEMASIISVHNNSYYSLQFILFLVSWFLFFGVITGTRSWFPENMDIFLERSNVNNLIAESFDSCSILEIVWTILPSFCLLIIGYPSISLLYSMDEQINSDFYIKIIGHQWFWSYEYPEIRMADNRSFKYDSIMLTTKDLAAAEYRQLAAIADIANDIISPETEENCFGKYMQWFSDFFIRCSRNVDNCDDAGLNIIKEHVWGRCPKGVTVDDVKLKNLLYAYLEGYRAMDWSNRDSEYERYLLSVNMPLIIPFNMPVTAVITSSDVLHSWAVPALGVKLDACPGRLNQVQFNSFFKNSDSFELSGDTLYWGQCSEFCGVGHGFMPIVVRSCHAYDFFDYLVFDMRKFDTLTYKIGMFGDYPSYYNR